MTVKVESTPDPGNDSFHLSSSHGKSSHGSAKGYSTKPTTKMLTSSPSKSTSGVWNAIVANKSLLLDFSLPIGFIFGGCCSNMFALESIIKYEADSGLAITLIQIIFTTAMAAWPQRDLSQNLPWVLRRPNIPFRPLMISAAFFWTVNMMNNWAFGFQISVPVHIILRSGGSIMSMMVGLVHGKRYTKSQFMGVILLTAGVITAAMADAQSKGKFSSSSSKASSNNAKSFTQGLVLLVIAQLLSAEMGVYTETIYTKYGRHWQENLLWSHLFSLFLFITVTPQLTIQMTRLFASEPIHIPLPSVLKAKDHISIPCQLVYLTLNSVTQFVCIQGVSRLAARISPLGVTIVLNIRKLVSLFLSIWVFGNILPFGVWVGAALVFLGGGVYVGWSPNAPRKSRKSEKDE